MKGFGGIASGLILGNLGFKVKGVTASQVLEDPEYFKLIFNKNKVIGFIGMSPTDSEHMQIVNAIYTGVLDSSYNGGLLAGVNHPTIKNVEDKSNPEQFLKENWHVDNPFLENPPAVTSIHMTTYKVDQNFGHTFFVSLSNLYDDCPSHLKVHLANARFVAETGSAGRDHVSHPALRTHPDTGETMLYWTGPGTSLEGGNTEWFDELYQWVDDYCAVEAHRYKWTWKEGDVVVWDNRAVLHGFYNGWTRDQRIFQRVEVGQEKPFHDPSYKVAGNENFGDVQSFPGVEKDKSKGPNPDHIPLVFTKGIYALKGLENFYQKVVLFVLTEDSILPERFVKFK